eukprot:s1230_g4.t1
MSLSRLLELDVIWTRRAQSMSLGYLEVLIYPGSLAFSWEGVGISLAIAGVCCGFQPLRVVLFALSYGQLLNRVLKMSFQRERPTPPEVKRLFKTIIPKDSHADGAAFPSGDTMAGSVTGASLALAGCGSGWWLLGLYVSWTAALGRAWGKMGWLIPRHQDGKLLGKGGMQHCDCSGCIDYRKVHRSHRSHFVSHPLTRYEPQVRSSRRRVGVGVKPWTSKTKQFGHVGDMIQ